MTDDKKESGFMNLLKDGLSSASQIISASIFVPITESAEVVLQNINDKMLKIEQRIIKKISALLIIALGSAFLSLSGFFLLKEYLHFNNTSAFFVTGVIIFIIGLILKINESNSNNQRD